MITITQDNVIIEDVDGNVIERESYIAELDANDLEKGAYPFYMIKEIDEQPAVLRRLVQEYQNDQHEFEIDTDLTDDLLNTERVYRSEEHTSELQSRFDLVCRLLLEKKK